MAISGLMARATFSKTKFLNEIMNEIKLVIGRDHYHYRKDVESILLYLFGPEEAKREAKAMLEEFASLATKVKFPKCQRYQLPDKDEHGKCPSTNCKKKGAGL